MPSSRRDRTSHISKLSKLSGPYAIPQPATSLRAASEESSDDDVADGDTWPEARSMSSTRPQWQNLDVDDLISELDGPVDHHFQSGDKVWVRTQEHNWRLGKVVKSQTRTRPLTRNDSHKEFADYYQVQFGGTNGKLNTRKYFAPLNGEMKPDSIETRELLQAGGWISGDLLQPVSSS